MYVADYKRMFTISDLYTYRHNAAVLFFSKTNLHDQAEARREN